MCSSGVKDGLFNLWPSALSFIFSYLAVDSGGTQQAKCMWNRAGQVYGLTLREVGGGLARHHRAPAIRAASYQIAKPSVLVSRIQKIKTFRGHRNAVYCG